MLDASQTDAGISFLYSTSFRQGFLQYAVYTAQNFTKTLAKVEQPKSIEITKHTTHVLYYSIIENSNVAKTDTPVLLYRQLCRV